MHKICFRPAPLTRYRAVFPKALSFAHFKYHCGVYKVVRHRESHDLGEVWSGPVTLPGTCHRQLELSMSACGEVRK